MDAKEILEVLSSIKDVRLHNNVLQIKFKDTHENPCFPDGWEEISGYNPGSFTEQLLLLIEEYLQKNNAIKSELINNSKQCDYDNSKNNQCDYDEDNPSIKCYYLSLWDDF